MSHQARAALWAGAIRRVFGFTYAPVGRIVVSLAVLRYGALAWRGWHAAGVALARLATSLGGCPGENDPFPPAPLESPCWRRHGCPL